jgi:hypothetical protein
MRMYFPPNGNLWGSCGHVFGRRRKVDRTAIPLRQYREGSVLGREGQALGQRSQRDGIDMPIRYACEPSVVGVVIARWWRLEGGEKARGDEVS